MNLVIACAGGALACVAACGTSAPLPAAPPQPIVGGPVNVADAPTVTDEEKLAAIQKAMNELSPAVQQCWAAVAVERFDIEGELAAQIDVGPPNTIAIVRDTTRTPKLAACVTAVLDHYPWAPPLHGQAIQLPFKFSAPEGQSVIDRRLVPFAGQGATSIAVLLDENNTNNANASMFEIAIAAGGTTGLRHTDRAELWYFLGPAVIAPAGGAVTRVKTTVAAGDMMFAGAGAAREVAATSGDVHAVIVAVPGGREGAARAGALPTPEVTSWRAAPLAPVVYPAAKAKPYGPATIYVEPATAAGTPLAASILALPAGAKVPEHVHTKETELLYILDGAGTMTIAGTDVSVVATSVIQIPPNTKHAFAASANVRALQIYTPAGPEQRFKK